MQKQLNNCQIKMVTICTKIKPKKTKLVVDRPYADIYNDEAVANETAEP